MLADSLDRVHDVGDAGAGVDARLRDDQDAGRCDQGIGHELAHTRLAVDEDQAETLGEVGGVERFAQSHLRAELLVGITLRQ